MKPLSHANTMSELLLNAWVTRPTGVALHYFDATWTFDDLVNRVTRLAGALKRLGVGRGDHIAVMLQNMPATVVVYLATWALGATIVPVNVMFQQAELEYHLADSEAKVLVILASVMDRMGKIPSPGTLVHVIVVQDHQDFCAKEAPRWLPQPTQSSYGTGYEELLDTPPLATTEWHYGSGHDMALLTYTSGTTGVPKGAMNTHRNILHNLSVYQSMADLDDQTINIAFAPLFHITGAVAGLAVSVGLAIPLVLLYRFDPQLAAQAITRHRATFTVGAITTFLGILSLSDLGHYDLSSLTHAYSGGAPVPAATVDTFQARTGVYIHNVYGLTESTNGLVMVPHREQAPVDPESGALSIGRAGQDILATIRDPDHPNRTLPPGTLGELALKGPSMITGYWNKPDETVAAFFEEWFLTGDMARQDAHGWIYIVDRKKDVIISAGNKVWPRDVEDILYEHPGVLEAVVVGLPDPYRGEAVTAFVVRQPEAQNLTEAELILFLHRRLAAYKVPRSVHWVETIPKTATGKFLRRAFRSGN